MPADDSDAYRPERARGDQTPPESPTSDETAPEETTSEQETSEQPTSDGPAEVVDDEDSPKPLFRDQAATRSPGSADSRADADDDTSTPADGSSEASAAGAAGGGLSDETTILSRAREHRRSRVQRDPDATTLLPRTAGGGRVRARAADDDFDDDDVEADPKADRRRLLLMIGAVAVVAILGLVAGYAIIRTTSQPVATPGPTGGTQSDPTASPSGDATDPGSTALLTDAMLLSPAQAETLDSKRTWKVALTQRGSSPDSTHHPACLSTDVADGAPTPQQTVLRLLSSNGSDSPAALHQVTAYGTAEEAAQAYAYASRALGDCAMTGAWVYEGHVVTGVGDQAVGVTVQVIDGSTEEFRTVVLARTGRVVDLVDVAKPDKAVTAKRVTEVTGDVVDTQCQAAGGACSDEPEAQDGPPPLGGDQPGFLASGDLPPVGKELARWAGTTPGEPDDDLLRGSGCETVNWSKVEAEDRSHRTYLLADSGSRFGLDEVVITTADEKAATDLAEKIRDDWKDCSKRQLTATVGDLQEISGPGAKSVDVKGWATEVTQKADDTSTSYRVGITAAGTKVAFVFLNPQDDLDLTADQFEIVTLRAGQRATQVN